MHNEGRGSIVALNFASDDRKNVKISCRLNQHARSNLMASGAGLPQWMAPCWLWENLWGLQRYTVKKPGEMRISKSEIADLDLKILNPHIWAPAGAVGAVGKRLMSMSMSLFCAYKTVGVIY